MIKSETIFQALEIVVKLPESYIDPLVKPVFFPALEDVSKLRQAAWMTELPHIHDPADKFS